MSIEYQVYVTRAQWPAVAARLAANGCRWYAGTSPAEHFPRGLNACYMIITGSVLTWSPNCIPRIYIKERRLVMLSTEGN